MLGTHAAAGPDLPARVKRHLATGATLVLTPALLRRVGALARMAGVTVASTPRPGFADAVEVQGRSLALQKPLEIEENLASLPSEVKIRVSVKGNSVPLLTSHRVGRGRILVWNVRSFSERDGGTNAPKPLGLVEIPRELADALRAELLAPLGVRLSAPARVGFYMFESAFALYNFRDEPVEVRLNGESIKLGPNRLAWR